MVIPVKLRIITAGALNKLQTARLRREIITDDELLAVCFLSVRQRLMKVSATSNPDIGEICNI